MSIKIIKVLLISIGLFLSCNAKESYETVETVFPKVDYDAKIHGPKIMGLFLGMNANEFAKTAEALMGHPYKISKMVEKVSDNLAGANVKESGFMSNDLLVSCNYAKDGYYIISQKDKIDFENQIFALVSPNGAIYKFFINNKAARKLLGRDLKSADSYFNETYRDPHKPSSIEINQKFRSEFSSFYHCESINADLHVVRHSQGFGLQIALVNEPNSVAGADPRSGLVNIESSFPSINYDQKVHGPRIKGLFIGMSASDFSKTAETLMGQPYKIGKASKETVLVIMDTSVPVPTMIKIEKDYHVITPKSVEDGLMNKEGLFGTANPDGTIRAVSISGLASKAIFKAPTLTYEEFISNFEQAYGVKLSLEANSNKYKSTTEQGILVVVAPDFSIAIAQVIKPQDTKKAFD